MSGNTGHAQTEISRNTGYNRLKKNLDLQIGILQSTAALCFPPCTERIQQQLMESAWLFALT